MGTIFEPFIDAGSGIRHGMPNRFAVFWLRQSQLLEDIAACSLDRAAIVFVGAGAHRVPSLEGRQNLLNLIGQPVPDEAQRAQGRAAEQVRNPWIEATSACPFCERSLNVGQSHGAAPVSPLSFSPGGSFL